MKITLCVPVPHAGDTFLELLAETANRLRSGRHEIALHVTCHDEEQQRRMSTAALSLPVTKAHLVPRQEIQFWHAASVTHSHCVNALFAGADADLAIICDFDMAFVHRNWDELLVEEFAAREVAFIGVSYAADAVFQFNLAQLSIAARKYQQKPNCMFVAFQPRKLKTLTDRLCDFAALYGDADSIPLAFVSNPTESRRFGLPVGSFVHLDTGSRIPYLIDDENLSYRLLERRAGDYAVLTSARFPANYPPYLYPEEYLWDGAPFVVHFRKGATKPIDGYTPDSFRRDVSRWIDRMSPSSEALEREADGGRRKR